MGSRFLVGGPNPLLGFIDLFVYLFAYGAGLFKILEDSPRPIKILQGSLRLSKTF